MTVDPTAPVNRLLEMAKSVQAVPIERIAAVDCMGRVLAEPVVADRDSPACDVSAMDGYAVRHVDLSITPLPRAPTPALIGQPPVRCPAGHAVHIVTGAPVPVGADTVVRIEDLIEDANHITLRDNVIVQPGTAVRRKGENLRAGATVLEPGQAITHPALATCATFGATQLHVRRRVRVAVLITGDEVLDPSQQPEPWQLRDSNGTALRAMLSSVPWIELVSVSHVPDQLDATTTALQAAIQRADAVIMTGGVSMGDRDFAKVAVEQVGAKVHFHGLPIRPGKPMLGAIAPDGKVILGLPGNPVSVLVTARRFGMVVLRKLAGLSTIDPPTHVVETETAIEPHATLWVYKPVRLTDAGRATTLPSMGSGDIASAGRSNGVIEVPPRPIADRRYAYYDWRC